MGETLSLKVIHQGNESVVEDGTSALIGSDASATVRIVRPGISRKHAVVSEDGGTWKVQDAGSRNGTYRDGKRVQTVEIDGPTTVFLGHPTDGEAISLVPVNAASTEPKTPAVAPSTETAATPDVDDAFDLPPVPPPTETATPPRRTPRSPAPRATDATRVQSAPVVSSASDVELAQLTAAIRDQISAVKGLTWSVWAMIAVTAALIVLTLFVGILSN